MKRKKPRLPARPILGEALPSPARYFAMAMKKGLSEKMT
jgi:hypothetical protein